MKRHQATFAQAIAINKALEGVVTSAGDGTCAYAGGHSDQTVGAALGLSPHSVAQVRKQVFGNLSKTSAPRDGLARRIAALEEKHNLLCQRLGAEQQLFVSPAHVERANGAAS